MTGLWIITGTILFLTVALVFATVFAYGFGRDGVTFGAGALACCNGVAAFIFTIVLISAYVDRANCKAWTTETGREARFVFYTPVTWACLAKTQDGTWLPKEQLREFGEQAG